jgi:peptidoglycan/LPS O-acetylase OafA/YrhL
MHPSRTAPATDPALTVPLLPSLTGLRWIAAFVVFAYHVRNLGYFSGRAQGLLADTMGAGATGVSLFFILSGFVLAWAHRPGTKPLTFWWRRVARIYPLHFVAVVLAVVVARFLMPSITTTSPKALLANFLLVSSWHGPWWQAGNPVSWSLVCEAFFYLCFPLVIRVLGNARAGVLWTTAALSVLLTLAVPSLLAALPGQLSGANWPPARLPEFVLGVTVACLIRSGAWRGPRLLVSVLVAVAGFVAVDRVPSSPFALDGFTVVGFTLLIAALARADVAGVRTGLSSRPLVALGERSFAFYLVHLLVIDALVALWPVADPRPAIGGLALMVLALCTALVLAAVLHRLVERPARAALLALPELFARSTVSMVVR